METVSFARKLDADPQVELSLLAEKQLQVAEDVASMYMLDLQKQEDETKRLFEEGEKIWGDLGTSMQKAANTSHLGTGFGMMRMATELSGGIATMATNPVVGSLLLAVGALSITHFAAKSLGWYDKMGERGEKVRKGVELITWTATPALLLLGGTGALSAGWEAVTGGVDQARNASNFMTAAQGGVGLVSSHFKEQVGRLKADYAEITSQRDLLADETEQAEAKVGMTMETIARLFDLQVDGLKKQIEANEQIMRATSAA